MKIKTITNSIKSINWGLIFSYFVAFIAGWAIVLAALNFVLGLPYSDKLIIGIWMFAYVLVAAVLRRAERKIQILESLLPPPVESEGGEP
jgi:ABC-type thiamin/hydroxymethylpyrimidine transport system permease subunit